MAGTGMALVFAPAANAVLGAVRPEEAGQASGATNAIRELGGVLGVAVLASVFAANGSYASPQAFIDGLTSARVGRRRGAGRRRADRAARARQAARRRGRRLRSAEPRPWRPRRARAPPRRWRRRRPAPGRASAPRRARRRTARRSSTRDLRELQALPVAHVRGAVDRHRDDRRAAQQREPADPAPRLRRRARRCASARPRSTWPSCRRGRARVTAVMNASSSANPRRTGKTPPCV